MNALGVQLQVNWPSLALAVIAAGIGFRAAWLWLQASKIQVTPLWPEGFDGQPFEPVIQDHAQDGWISGLLIAMNASAKLNASAARWTAWSVVLSVCAAVAGAITFNGA